MIRIVRVRDAERFASRARPRASPSGARTVRRIIDSVRREGDAAVRRYERRFGSDVKSLRVSKREIHAAYYSIPRAELAALRRAKLRLQRSERALLSGLRNSTVRSGGVRISRRFAPLRSVGCYVPGGLARYPSSAVMSVVPARTAGVGRIVVVTPPHGGSIAPSVLVAADMCGATEIYRTGGAQGIAALAYGTKSIRPVDKIVGPGGAVVTEAKSLVSSHTAIDMLAGPTELAIISDSSSDASHVAADLISQAEHSGDTFCYVITDSIRHARAIDRRLDSTVPGAHREKIIRDSLAQNGFIAVCRNSDMARLADLLAPEHLQIMTRDARSLARRIRTAGLVLLGPHTPSAASDYMLGSNHILPTCGSGRARGALSVLDFLKLDTTITSSRAELRGISGHVRSLAHSEDLQNHHAALEARL